MRGGCGAGTSGICAIAISACSFSSSLLALSKLSLIDCPGEEFQEVFNKVGEIEAVFFSQDIGDGFIVAVAFSGDQCREAYFAKKGITCAEQDDGGKYTAQPLISFQKVYRQYLHPRCVISRGLASHHAPNIITFIASVTQRPYPGIVDEYRRPELLFI